MALFLSILRYQDIVDVAKRDVEVPQFPILADPQRHLAVKLAMLDPKEKDETDMPLTCRAVMWYSFGFVDLMYGR